MRRGIALRGSGQARRSCNTNVAVVGCTDRDRGEIDVARELECHGAPPVLPLRARAEARIGRAGRRPRRHPRADRLRQGHSMERRSVSNVAEGLDIYPSPLDENPRPSRDQLARSKQRAPAPAGALPLAHVIRRIPVIGNRPTEPRSVTSSRPATAHATRGSGITSATSSGSRRTSSSSRGSYRRSSPRPSSLRVRRRSHRPLL